MPISPLLGEHAALGATFTDFAGWQMPLKYSSELAEHHAVRATAGLFDLSHMGEIEIEGPGSGAFLDYALAGAASEIGVGRAKYSLICAENGGVIDDLVVYRLGAQRFLVVANAANASAVVGELEIRATGFAAAITDRSADTALIAVQGPAAQEIVGDLVDAASVGLTTDLKYYAAMPATVAGIAVLLARTGYTGEDGFELYVANESAVPLWQALLAAVTSRGGLPTGLACRDTLRLEAGMALYGHELTVALDPYSAGLGRVVRLGKEFVGRAALQQRSAIPLQRMLVGLRGSGRRAGRAGYRVCDVAGTVIGEVTSGALSPTLGYPVALAYLDVACAEKGTKVSVDVRGTREPYVVAPLPFYRRS
ncbi:glycine cleavage system aminomethyltransferase GcvT [Nocardia sp. NPDC052112]|uniref:glycine cleavage system aminomethyltransferase GcvT n=1 Tax=Nocardia sp. NPDC052112 TaxID=3155646 RepID=UPI00344AC66E